MDETFLTVAEIAEQLRLNQQTVRNWIDRGELAAIRLGARRVRVRASELERFIAASSSAGLPDEATARQRVRRGPGRRAEQRRRRRAARGAAAAGRSPPTR